MRHHRPEAPASHSGVGTPCSHTPLCLAGCDGGHLFCSEQDTAGTTAGTRAVIQPGSAQGHEETDIHTVIATERLHASPCPPCLVSWKVHRHQTVCSWALSDHKSSTKADQPSLSLCFPFCPGEGPAAWAHLRASPCRPRHPASSFPPERNQMITVTSPRLLEPQVLSEALVFSYHCLDE
jgi:hypothetical protein